MAARRAALAAVRDVEVDGAWSTIAVPDRVAKLADARDRSLASRLAYDTIRWQGTLDWALSFASRREPDQIEPDLLRILRMGALQLLRLRVPARAVVDTAAELAREAVPAGRGKGAAGFVNGVLRGLGRQLDGDGLPWPQGDGVEALALTTAHPGWVVEGAVARFGDGARSVLEADNDAPGLTLRANADRDELVAELVAAGIDASPHPSCADAVRAPGADPRRLACVAQGRAVPQDAASMLVARAVAPAPGAAVLDLCAGPGGKATHLAHLVGATGRVTGIEQHPHRADLVAQAARRQGVDVEVLVGDGRDADRLVAGRTFDAVLLDAPCSGLGVGRRRPEVRWRRTPQDITALAELQAQLLASAAGCVMPGGRLTYAVCTWTLEETASVIARSASVLADFVPGDERQIRPDLDDADGMFVATWTRRS